MFHAYSFSTCKSSKAKGKSKRETGKEEWKIQNSNLIELVSTSPYHAPEPWVINTNSPSWTDIGAFAVTEYLHFEGNLIALKEWWAVSWYNKGWLTPNNRPRVNIWGNIRTPSFKTWKRNFMRIHSFEKSRYVWSWPNMNKQVSVLHLKS